MRILFWILWVFSLDSKVLANENSAALKLEELTVGTIEMSDFKTWDENLKNSHIEDCLNNGLTLENIVDEKSDPMVLVNGDVGEIFSYDLPQLIAKIREPQASQEYILEFKAITTRTTKQGKNFFIWIHCSDEKGYIISSSLQPSKYQISAELLGDLFDEIYKGTLTENYEGKPYKVVETMLTLGQGKDEHLREEIKFNYGLYMPNDMK